ncbi:MAG: GNAT family N-acetyltransferase [Anaerolineae bacterium]|nr:GNAT family N-acetyltransferase [Anaerolineae bacterium]
MTELTVRAYLPSDAQAVFDLQLRYERAYPGAQILPPLIYAQPVYAGGANILCVCGAEGRLLGYAPIYPTPTDSAEGPSLVWTVLKVDPEIQERRDVQDALYAALHARVAEIRAADPPGPARLSAECGDGETEAIAYLEGRGWRREMNAYRMERDLGAPLPEPPAPQRVAIREWDMRAADERRVYLEAIRLALPEAASDAENLHRFLAEVVWRTGTTLAAFAAERLVGNVMIYWDPAEIARTGRKIGITEDIWVLPQWRRQGVASAMIARALAYLRDKGMQAARLSVAAPNERALRLYTRLGYRIVSESRILSLNLD